MAEALIPMMKRCTKCGVTKPDERFALRGPSEPGKRSTWCKACMRVNARRCTELRHARLRSERPWRKWSHVSEKLYLQAFKVRHHKLALYGLKIDEYLDMVETCKGRCEICGKRPDDQSLAVDHCHDSGKVRGLLCSECNLGLGKLGDTADALERALKYLTRK